MLILTRNPDGSICRAIPLHNIAQFEFQDAAVCLHFIQNVRNSTQLFAVGKSAQKLHHALVEKNPDSVYLAEWELLNTSELMEWRQLCQPQSELAGLLEASELVEVGP